MHLFPISDIHIGMRNEFFHEDNIRSTLGFLEDYGDDIIMCACGDIGDRMEGFLWLKKVLDIFPKLRVVYTPGNHEYYGANLDVLPFDLRQASAREDRLFVLDGAYTFAYKLSDINFIGAPLWTDFNKSAPSIMNEAQRNMNDYRFIRTSGDFKLLNANRVLNEHHTQRKEIFKRLEKLDGKCVVITHHAPIIINQGHADSLSFAYCSDLTNDLDTLKNPPIYWLSGHTHSSHVKKMSFENGETTFISNQMGYPIEFNTGFTCNCILEI